MLTKHLVEFVKCLSGLQFASRTTLALIEASFNDVLNRDINRSLFLIPLALPRKLLLFTLASFCAGIVGKKVIQRSSRLWKGLKIVFLKDLVVFELDNP